MPANFDPGPLAETECIKNADSWTLVFVCDMPYPPQKVWEVLTDPKHLPKWAPFTSDRNLGHVGHARMTMLGGYKTTGEFDTEVTRADAPSVLEFTWGPGLVNWQLTPIETGTRLTLRNRIDDLNFISKAAAGWHLCLLAADRWLAGQPIGPVAGAASRDYGWDALNDAYAEKMGVPNTGWPLGPATKKTEQA